MAKVLGVTPLIMCHCKTPCEQAGERDSPTGHGEESHHAEHHMAKDEGSLEELTQLPSHTSIGKQGLDTTNARK